MFFQRLNSINSDWIFSNSIKATSSFLHTALNPLKQINLDKGIVASSAIVEIPIFSKKLSILLLNWKSLSESFIWSFESGFTILFSFDELP